MTGKRSERGGKERAEATPSAGSRRRSGRADPVTLTPLMTQRSILQTGEEVEVQSMKETAVRWKVKR
jgi:hypothetical protein